MAANCHILQGCLIFIACTRIDENIYCTIYCCSETVGHASIKQLKNSCNRLKFDFTAVFCQDNDFTAIFQNL